MDENRQYVILRTYNSVWKIERKIYSIENIKLLFPVSPNEVLYFAVSLGLTMMLIRVIPFMSRVPFLIKYAGIPFVLMKFFTKQKLDGKLPHKFFVDYIIYALSAKRGVRFSDVEMLKEVRFVTPIAWRDIQLVNKTEQLLNGKGAKKKWFGRREKSTDV